MKFVHSFTQQTFHEFCGCHACPCGTAVKGRSRQESRPSSEADVPWWSRVHQGGEATELMARKEAQ